MAFNYDELYRETPNALGAPTYVIVQAFERMDSGPLDVLDIGCGQGRDALFIARMGHRVTGVDLSASGVNAMVEDAMSEGLDVIGVATDITTFEPEGTFDILLIDRTLHMLNETDRHSVLRRLLSKVREGGQVLIADEKSNMAGFKSVIAADTRDWETSKDDRGYLFLRHEA